MAAIGFVFYPDDHFGASPGETTIKTQKGDEKIQRLKSKANDVKRLIERRKSAVQSITEKETVVIKRFNQVDQTLTRLRKNNSAIKARLFTLGQKIAEITDHSKMLTRQIKAMENDASRRLISIYKLGWLGKMRLLAAAESFYEFVYLKKNLERILVYDETVLKDLRTKKDHLSNLLDQLNEKKMKKRLLEADYERQIKIMSAEKRKRAKLLEAIRNNKSLQLAALDSLKEAAGALDQTIKSLSREFESFGPIKKLFKKSFPALKGLLDMPVKGKIVARFGSYKDTRFDITGHRSGIGIRTEMGEPVHAVSAGRVIFSGWFKGYGNMMIIDHGNNYCTVYAHVYELFKKLGDMVDTREVIATAGETGFISGPRLYFEIRHFGKAVDPLKWIRKG